MKYDLNNELENARVTHPSKETKTRFAIKSPSGFEITNYEEHGLEYWRFTVPEGDYFDMSYSETGANVEPNSSHVTIDKKLFNKSFPNSENYKDKNYNLGELVKAFAIKFHDVRQKENSKLEKAIKNNRKLIFVEA